MKMQITTIHFASEIFQIKSVVAQYRDTFALCLKEAFSLEEESTRGKKSGVKRGQIPQVYKMESRYKIQPLVELLLESEQLETSFPKHT